jgi:hypothetical protein
MRSMHAVATALSLAALLLVGASAQQQPAPPDPSSEEASMLGYGDRDKTCAEWTDGCMTCTRADNGDPQCPNIGIACQPRAISCVKPNEPAKQ